jgi:hypothetical protein
MLYNFRVMIVEIQIVYIGTTKFTPKDWSEPVFFSSMGHKILVLGSPVWSPQYLGWSYTGCSPWLPVLGVKNWTKHDFHTLDPSKGKQTCSTMKMMLTYLVAVKHCIMLGIHRRP